MPWDDIFRMIRGIQNPARGIESLLGFDPTCSMTRGLNQSLLNLQKSIAGPMAGFDSAFQSRRNFLDGLSGIHLDLNELNRNWQVQIESMIGPAATAFQRISNQQHNSWDAILKSIPAGHDYRNKMLNESAYLSQASWQSATTKLANLCVASSGSVDIERALHPFNVHRIFIQDAFHKLSIFEDEQHPEAQALRTSIELVDGQLLEIEELVNSFDQLEEAQPCQSKANLDAPEVQQRELLNHATEIDFSDGDSIANYSPSTQIPPLGASIGKLLHECNEAAFYSPAVDNKPIFKYTGMVLVASIDLVWLLPQAKKEFGDFLDYIYFILYEAAGKDHLRYTKIMGSEDCEFIWHIKHIRNYWLRHDVDHGKTRDIDKKKHELLESMQYFGLKGLPYTSDDFRKLHENILKCSVVFLMKLRSVLTDN